MVTVAATARVGSVKDNVVKPVDGLVNDTNKMMFWNDFL